MGLSLIAAVARNGVIGSAGDLPWRLRSDLRRFKRLTMGHWLILGRKTFESIPRPLPGRRILVVSRQPELLIAGVEVVDSLARGLERVGSERAFCGGGAELYGHALGHCERLYITWVEAEVDGDVEFPEVDWENWRAIERESVAAGDGDQYATTFTVYERRQ